MSEDKGEGKGWKQLRALELINNHPEGGTFLELTEAVRKACFPETYTADWVDEFIRSKFPKANEEYIQSKADRQREGKARHLVRYLLKHQDTPDPGSGKKQTLREQGRIILPGKDAIIRESMGSVMDDETGKARKGAAKPKRSTPMKLSEEEKTPQPMTGERLALFRQAASKLKAKNATKELEEIARAGAHRFRGGTVIKKKPTETPAAPEETKEVV